MSKELINKILEEIGLESLSGEADDIQNDLKGSSVHPDSPNSSHTR